MDHYRSSSNDQFPHDPKTIMKDTQDCQEGNYLYNISRDCKQHNIPGLYYLFLPDVFVHYTAQLLTKYLFTFDKINDLTPC